MTLSSLVNYRIAYPALPLPPIQASLYEYVLAGNGAFVRGERRELAALFPIASCEIRGLAELEPKIELRVPRIPQDAVLRMLDEARQAEDGRGLPAEIIFHLSVDEPGVWIIEVPEQLQEPARAQPLDDSGSSSYARAFVEVHSHVGMPARFSGADDGDELGFRLYAILGSIFDRPELRVRIGLYGYRMEIRASQVFDLPPEISDVMDGTAEPGLGKDSNMHLDLSDESDGHAISICAGDADKQIAPASCETFDEENPETYLD